MNKPLIETIDKIFSIRKLEEHRKTLLQPLINLIQQKVNTKAHVNLNFICTHNSRRSHFAQVWAQTAAAYFNIPQVFCYSGGSQETALFPMVAETLSVQGFVLAKISETDNPVYIIKYSENALPIIGFSKKYDNPFNPGSAFTAIMTCSQADEACPFIAGAEKRIPITYQDPKSSDGSAEQEKIYAERSLQIATEMFYIFSKIKA